MWLLHQAQRQAYQEGSPTLVSGLALASCLEAGNESINSDAVRWNSPETWPMLYLPTNHIRMPQTSEEWGKHLIDKHYCFISAGLGRITNLGN